MSSGPELIMPGCAKPEWSSSLPCAPGLPLAPHNANENKQRFARGIKHVEAFWAYNRGKKSITMNPRTAAAADLFRQPYSFVGGNHTSS